MNLEGFKDYFLDLSKKRIIGHNPATKKNRFIFLRSSMKMLTDLDEDNLTLMVYEPRLRTRVEGGLFRNYYECNLELFQPCDLENEAQEIAIKSKAQQTAQKLFLKVMYDYHQAFKMKQPFPFGMPEEDSFSGQYFANTGQQNECGFQFLFTFKEDLVYNRAENLIEPTDWE